MFVKNNFHFKSIVTIMVLCLTISLFPVAAFAEPDSENESDNNEEETVYTLTVNNDMIQQFNTWQDQVDSANKTYEEHMAIYNDLMETIKQHEEEAERLKKKIEDNQEILSNLIVENYKQHEEESIINLILNSQSLSDFITNIKYAECIRRPFNNAIIENKQLKIEQEEILNNLETDRKNAEEQLTIAEESKKEVDDVSERIRKKINGELSLYSAPPVPEEGYKDVIEAGISRLGLPYVWGGKGEGNVSFDCSGLTHWCYEKTYGVNIGISTSEQYAKADKILPLSEAKRGDVLFRFAEDGSAAYQHVAIYIGKFGNMEHAYLHTPSQGRLSEIRDGIDSFDCVLRFNCTGN